MDAIEFIIEDHERFRGMIDRYGDIDPDDGQARRELVDQLIDELVRHGTMEEQVLYPFVLENVAELEDDVREEIEEHHVLEVLMAELRELDATHEQFDAKFEVFEEIVLHHFEEEEEELFPALREHLDQGTLDGLTADLRAAKERASTQPDPDRVGG